MTAAGSDHALRVALIGYGLAGSVFHAPLITSIDDFVLDTVVTASPERQAKVTAQYPDARVVSSPDELWPRAGELNLVVVASPNRTHVPLATEALRAGLPVVVEKPFAATAALGATLADLADEMGLMLSVYQNRRWDGDFLTLRQLVDKGELGDVWRCESRFERWRPRPADRWRESGDPAEVGGLLYDLGSHLVDQALVLFGPVAGVYAEAKVRRPGAQVDDDTFIALEHASGTVSHLWMNVISAQPAARLRALGSHASYVKYGVDPQEAALGNGACPGPGWGVEPEQAWGSLTLGASGDGTTETRLVPTIPGDYPAYYRGIAHALRAGAPPPVTTLEAVAGLQVLEAAHTSAQEGRTVRVAPS